MSRLLTVAGAGCVAAAAVWFLLAAREGGFLPAALLSLFLPSDRDRSPSRLERDIGVHLLGEHWEDVKGPFYLMLFGAALMLCADRVATALGGP